MPLSGGACGVTGQNIPLCLVAIVKVPLFAARFVELLICFGRSFEKDCLRKSQFCSFIRQQKYSMCAGLPAGRHYLSVEGTSSHFVQSV